MTSARRKHGDEEHRDQYADPTTKAPDEAVLDDTDGAGGTDQ